ncbi:MAG: RcnB family protein [Sphingomonadales bacterium]
MRKTILAGLLAATLVPVAAQAQSPINPSERRELQRDRQDVREERRDLNRAYRNGDPRQIREERRDYRDARQEYRGDARDARRNWGRDDWRGYRDQNRSLYRGGAWRSEYRYQQFRPGVRIGVGYYSPRYVISDPWRYRLPAAGFSQRWVRHYNDVLLVDVRSGRVIDVIRGFYF